MARVGRNDPCPCGSGKKFKRCCDEASDRVAGPSTPRVDDPESAWARAHAAVPKMHRALGEHMVEWLGERRVRRALADFELPEGVRTEDERAVWMQLLISWTFYDWVPKGKTQTVAQHFLANARRPHDADVVSLIRSTSEEALSFHQVENVEPGRGVTLRDLYTGEQRFVLDRSLSAMAQPGGIIFARLAPFGEVTIFDVLGPRPLGPDWAAEIAACSKDFGWKLPLARTAVRAEVRMLIALYFDSVETDDERRAAFPTLHTSDGELLVFCKDTWKVRPEKRGELPAILEKLGLERDERSSGVFTWVRDDHNDGTTSTLRGRVTLEGTELVLETISRERQKRLKAKLGRALGKRAEHVSSDERSAEAEMKRPRLVPVEPRREPTADEIAAVRALTASHYASWPDIALPAFGGRTPRQMTKTKTGRAAVAALIREMEYHSHGTPMAGVYDFDVLRRELGLG